MKKPCAILLVAAAVGLASARPAHAAAIGVFSWDTDFCPDVFSPCFTVLNIMDPADPSPFDFLHLNVSIVEAAGASQTLYPGSFLPGEVTLHAGETLTTLDDLANVSIVLATLSFQLLQPGTLRLLDDGGNRIEGLTSPNTSAVIDFQAQTEPAPVPEPGTLMLLGTGLAALAVRRSRR